MTHPGTLKQAFPNTCVQSHLKSAHPLVAKTVEVLVPICRVLCYGRVMPETWRLSYTAEFICEVVGCVGQKANRAAAIIGVDEGNIWLWQKHKAVDSECEKSQRRLTRPKEGRFPEVDDTVFTFFETDSRLKWTVLYCSYSTYSSSLIFLKCRSRLGI
jgi:hypothetical protein